MLIMTNMPWEHKQKALEDKGNTLFKMGLIK